MKYTIISNTCLGADMLRLLNNMPYSNPFIGSIFLDDMDYAKFCSNFNHYINQKPIFKEPKNKIWSKQTGNQYWYHPKHKNNYPVMHLDDIQIHWIHETDEKIVLEKYQRRLERFKNNYIPIFTWIETEMFTRHNNQEHKQMIDMFFQTENCIFIGSKRYIPNNLTNKKIYYKHFPFMTMENHKRINNNFFEINNQKEFVKLFLKQLKIFFKIG